MGCRVGAGGGAELEADVISLFVLVVMRRLAPAVPGLEAPPSGGRAPVTGGVPGLPPADVPGLEAGRGGEGAPEELPFCEVPDTASCSTNNASGQQQYYRIMSNCHTDLQP